MNGQSGPPVNGGVRVQKGPGSSPTNHQQNNYHAREGSHTLHPVKRIIHYQLHILRFGPTFAQPQTAYATGIPYLPLVVITHTHRAPPLVIHYLNPQSCKPLCSPTSQLRHLLVPLVSPFGLLASTRHSQRTAPIERHELLSRSAIPRRIRPATASKRLATAKLWLSTSAVWTVSCEFVQTAWNLPC